jgi:uncharacterized membrane protein YbhN (UPF0104 family)
MRFDRGKITKAAAISALLLAVLFWFADLDTINFKQFDLRYLAGCVLLYFVMLILRAIGFGLIASQQGKQVGFRNWLKLAAQHQLIFLVAPSGSGDFVFPHLARKITNIDIAAATNIILRSRLRDICTILGLGICGLVSTGIIPTFFTFFAFIAFIIMVWIEPASIQISKALKHAFPKFFPENGWAYRFHSTSEIGFNQRAKISILTLAIWLIASTAIWVGFMAVGYQINFDGAWVMIAGLNIAGALAISVAGFGVAEAGATGVLILLGETASNAAAIAIVARLGLLLSILIAAIGLEAFTRLWLRFRN